MANFDVIQRIKELCEARSWSYYRLAKEADIPYSTLSTMLRKTNVPSVPTIEKLCTGFGISLSQFFLPEDEVSLLRSDQRKCLEQWERLDEKSRELALSYLQGLKDRQDP